MSETPSPLALEWLAGGSANAITSAILNPLDVSKTRIQTTTANLSPLGKLRWALRGLYTEGGITGLWRPGLNASIMRELLSSGPRAGFYVPVREQVNSLFGLEKIDSSNRLLPKIISAMITGTLGSLIANPVDVIKIRLMADPDLYPSTIQAVSIISRTEGFAALYKGLIPSTLRGACIAAGELATYDFAKKELVCVFGIEASDEGTGLHVAASLITGFVATSVAAPFDLLKSRAMNERGASSTSTYLFLKTAVEKDGPQVLLRGWLPSYLRLGPHALICFPMFEQIRKLLGLDYL